MVWIIAIIAVSGSMYIWHTVTGQLAVEHPFIPLLFLFPFFLWVYRRRINARKDSRPVPHLEEDEVKTAQKLERHRKWGWGIHGHPKARPMNPKGSMFKRWK